MGQDRAGTPGTSRQLAERGGPDDAAHDAAGALRLQVPPPPRRQRRRQFSVFSLRFLVDMMTFCAAPTT